MLCHIQEGYIRHICHRDYLSSKKLKTKLRGFSPQENYTDWATVACRRS
jgi:hypothetical protein